MRRIRVFAHTSLDGVIQAPGGPDEDRDGDFDCGGWAMPHLEPSGAEALKEAQGTRFDLLLARRTYGRKSTRDSTIEQIAIRASREIPTRCP